MPLQASLLLQKIRKTPWPPFETGLALSLLLHLALWQVFSWRKHVHSLDADAIEIDLTRPFRLTSNPLLARRAAVPGTGAPVVTEPRPGSSPAQVAAAVPKPPSDWVLPGPDTKELVKPADQPPVGAVGGKGDGTGLGGRGDGTGTGEVDWVYLTEFPRLLNKERMKVLMRQYYPPVERAAGREGLVVLNVVIDRSGNVAAMEVAQSAGEAFDQAAKRLMGEARFAPGMVGKEPVVVKLPQQIYFDLDD